MTNVDFSDANLSGAGLLRATLTNANLTGANINGADLSDTTSRGFTKEQLYSTASYANGSLRGVGLAHNDLSMWDLSGQDLTQADLREASLQGTDLSNANLTAAVLIGASGFSPDLTTVTRNMVWPDGQIHGVDLAAGDELVLPSRAVVEVKDSFRATDGSVLEIAIAELRVGERGCCSSSRHAEVNLGDVEVVELGGTLGLVAEEIHLSHISGRVYGIFDWPSSGAPSTKFAVVEWPAGRWDDSQLYTTGEVKLIEQYDRDVHAGDFNIDGQVNADDIDRLSAAVRVGRDISYDLDDRFPWYRTIDQRDRRAWVEDLVGTSFGDANLNGTVDFEDFLALSEGFGQRGGWAQGDFDGDGTVAFPDFLMLSEEFGQSQLLAANVPEPSVYTLLVVALVMVQAGRKRLV